MKGIPKVFATKHTNQAPVGFRVLLLTVLITGFLHGEDNGKLSATSIVQKMAMRYPSVQSYRDDGVVLTYAPFNPRPDEIRFKTWFVRPGAFRFEWTAQPGAAFLKGVKNHFVIWSEGKHAYFYDKYAGFPPTTEKEDSLADAIASATGVSGGASHTVPRLLMKTVPGFALTELKDLKSLGIEVFEGVRCHHLVGQHPHGYGPMELWIGSNDFLSRKRKVLFKGTPEEQIHRSIKTNIRIPAENLTFKPKK
jgi:outer membrane lipoprotein-sorting protein